MAPGPSRTMLRARTSAPITKRMVKDMIESRIEHKVGCVLSAETVVTTAGSVKLITSNISQGSDINNRDGDMIIIDRIRMTINVRNTDTAATNIFSTRFILFSDELNTGAAPAVGDVLNSASIFSGVLPVNKQKQRFRIYADFVLDSVSNTSTATVTRILNHKINRKCFFSGTSGSTSNGKGALFLLEIANFAGANNLHTYGWELVYSDA